jgi:hypothetical protein
MTQRVSASVDLSRLRRLQAAIDAGGQSPIIRTIYKQWAARVRGYLQERFVQYSRGGGTWPPLKRKRKRGSLASVAILRDTNTMFAALNPVFQGQPGALEEPIAYGIRVGFGGPVQHPSGTFTVADLAGWHHTGAGRLPVRTIIDTPPVDVQDGMAKDAERGLTKLAATL